MLLCRSKIILVCFTAVVLIIGLAATAAAAQIGHRTLTFYDSARDDRIVPAEVYYPSDQNGDNGPVSTGRFPLLVFAHGYQQVFNDYHGLWEHLVPEGYIMVFPTTEGGLTIDIDEYAKDLSFLLDTLLDKSSGNDLFLTGHLNGASALMGHSTGGGACYLAQKSDPIAHTVISLAALGSLYGPIYGSSPLDAAKGLTVPGLVMAGGEDCICPVKENQQAIYDNLVSSPRALITITRGDHCGFSDSSNCWIGEAAKCGFLGQGPTISEDLQMTLTLQYVLLWLDSIIKGDERSWTSFQESLKQDPQISYTLAGENDWPPGFLSAPVLSMETNKTMVSLFWNPILGASAYTLFYAPYPYTGSIGSLDMGNQTSFSINLWSGAAFYVAVKARNKTVFSNYSNMITVQVF